MMRHAKGWLCIAALAACNTDVGLMDDADAEGDEANAGSVATNSEQSAGVEASSEGDVTTGPADLETGTGSGETESGESDSESEETGFGFVTISESSEDEGEGDSGLDGTCDFLDPNSCVSDQKCTWRGDEGTIGWEQILCVPLLGDKAVGESCEVLGWAYSGLDDCERGALCIGASDSDLTGECRSYCTGTYNDLMCPNLSTCAVSSGSGLALCVPTCDLLAQDCPGANELCLQTGAGPQCTLDVSGGQAPYGTPCVYANACNAGLECAAPEWVPDPQCAGASACCTPYCDLTVPNPCPGSAEGQVCLPLDPELEWPEYAHIGVCRLP